ncbi:hypothetical protein RND81_07G128800 [Saponaria officinalis]|uniref:Cysteine-rich receptor-like protein kinase 10 n=1 Tax=Saponaria officinalis TaxID=3572 RepID=A0AAW1JQ30_SAPOF
MGKIVLVLALLFLVCQLCITVNAEINYVNKCCAITDFNYTKGSVYEDNLSLLFSKLALKTSSLKFYNATAGSASNEAYGLFQCRDDIDFDICTACVKNATQRITEVCPLYGEATVWYYECTLRYANRNIFSVYNVDCLAEKWSLNNVTKYDEFAPVLASTLNGVIKNSSSTTQRFDSAVAELTLFNQLYGFAQCTPDLDSAGCNTCLKKALAEIVKCCNASVYAMVFYPSCQLRYDTTGPFLSYQSSLAPPPGTYDDSGTREKSSSMSPAIIGAIVGCVVVGLIVLSIVLWICLCHKNPGETSSDGLLATPVELPDDPENFGPSTESEQYDFNTLRIATRDFSAEFMLGEGGFGIVYKGALKNGEQLAIKRLSKGTTGQGTKEFLAEARLLAKLQHKNLVRLVGFCSEKEEKLLVYEFMSNSSLDRFLFDPRNRPLLDWPTRYKIIMGIARGLQYLHEDSRLTIVHRDLKPGNILLDKEMNPKIADFGLAKLFESAEKFGNTVRVVGTQGYMAPEYMMSGDYSDKSDVYSYGIMLLEIVSGQKNRMMRQTPQREDLSIQAWKLWDEERSFEITDPIIVDDCSRNVVMRCIQIGLLCVQPNAYERPTMTEVVLMLTGSVDLPSPSPPIMPSNQYTMNMTYSGGQTDQYSTKSVTINTDMGPDLYPRAR